MSDTIMMWGRCVGFDIIMQQSFTRLCCEDAADKTVVLLNLSCMRVENTSLSSTHGVLQVTM